MRRKDKHIQRDNGKIYTFDSSPGGGGGVRCLHYKNIGHKSVAACRPVGVACCNQETVSGARTTAQKANAL